MMLQPTHEMKRLEELMDKETDQKEYDKLHEEYVKLVREQRKALDGMPFAH